MLWKLAKDLHEADGPTHLAVILDHSSKSFRNDIYDQYKANRPEPPEDLRPQFPLIRDATRSEEHTSELQSLMRISYDVFFLKKKTQSFRTRAECSRRLHPRHTK